VAGSLAAACAVPATAETLDDARESLRAAEIAFAQAFADRDVTRFLSFVAPDGVFLGGDSVARGPEEVRVAWAPLFEPPTPPFSWRPERVEVLESGSLGLSTGPIFDPQGKRTGNYVSTWRRRGDGTWEVVFDGGPPPCPRCECTTPEPPGANN
jgi:ketosteroid isomerase-like protein